MQKGRLELASSNVSNVVIYAANLGLYIFVRIYHFWQSLARLKGVLLLV